MSKLHYHIPLTKFSLCGKDNFDLKLTTLIENVTCKSCLKVLRNKYNNEINTLYQRIERIKIQEHKLKGE